MEYTAGIWKRAIIGAIAILALAAIGGAVYLWFVWPSSDKGGAQGDGPALTREEQIQENLNSLTAPAPSSTSAAGGASVSQKPAPALNAPAPETPAQEQPGQGNINSLTAP